MNANTQILRALGQSLWLDNITREILDNGMLARYIAELSVTGLTSNPTIFEKAIAEGNPHGSTRPRRGPISSSRSPARRPASRRSRNRSTPACRSMSRCLSLVSNTLWRPRPTCAASSGGSPRLLRTAGFVTLAEARGGRRPSAATAVGEHRHQGPGRRGQPDGGGADTELEAFRMEGIDDAALADRLQREGAEKFTMSWHALIARIREETGQLCGSVPS